MARVLNKHVAGSAQSTFDIKFTAKAGSPQAEKHLQTFCDWANKAAEAGQPIQPADPQDNPARFLDRVFSLAAFTTSNQRLSIYNKHSPVMKAPSKTLKPIPRCWGFTRR
eukprot:m.461862 g.461862  ORF g.461862 m.461862 type:complete len:110 (-) comp20348_c0_seq9:552-881(-)